jgi:hypothetical protein
MLTRSMQRENSEFLDGDNDHKADESGIGLTLKKVSISQAQSGISFCLTLLVMCRLTISADESRDRPRSRLNGNYGPRLLVTKDEGSLAATE